MKALLAIEMETGDMADYEPRDEGRQMNKKQIERAAWVRDEMNERAERPECDNVNERDKRIEKLERRVAQQAAQAAEAIVNLSIAAIEQHKRIEKLKIKLEQRTIDLTAIIADGTEINAEVDCKLRQRVDEQAKRIESLWDIVIEHAEHIEKLEAVLREVAP